MNGFYAPYVYPVIVSTILAGAVAVFAARRRHITGALALAVLMAAVSFWSLFYALELIFARSVTDIYWKFEYLGIQIIPTAWFVFVLQYTGRGGWLTRRKLFLLSLEPALVILLAWTNSYHHLIWSDIFLVPASGITVMEARYGWGFWLYVSYSYVLIFISTILIMQFYLRSIAPYRHQAAIVLLGALAPWVANAIYVFRLNLFPHFDLTPFAFTVTGLAATWALLRFRFLELIPLAYHTLIESMRDGLAVLNLQGQVVYINPAGGRIVGLPVDKVIGEPADKIFVGENAVPALTGWILTHLTNGTADHGVITQGEAENRRWYEIRISSLCDGQGRPNGKLLVWHDITEYKHSEAAIREGEQRYRQLVEGSPDPIFSINYQGVIVSWNKACEMVFLYGQEIIGRPYRQILISPEDHTDLDLLISRVFDQKLASQDIDLEFRCQDGTHRAVVTRLYPLTDSTGTVESCVFANHDVTGRKSSEQALLRQLTELTVLHSIATACVEVAGEDELVERATHIIGQILYGTDRAHNFGVLLLDEDEQVLKLHSAYQGISDELREKTLAIGDGITGRVAATGRAVRVDDVDLVADYRRLHLPTRSELCVPMKIGERVIGVINIESDKKAAFNVADERLLDTLAGQLATAIERLRVEAAERRRVEELLAITRVGREISSMLDPQKVFDSIVRNATELSHADGSGLFTYRSDGRFYLVSSYGVGEVFIRSLQTEGVPIDGSAVGRAALTRRPVQIPDVRVDVTYQIQDLAGIENIRSVLAVPLLQEDVILGGIVLWNRQPRRFSSQEELFLQALAQQSVNVIENARLFDTERAQRKLAEVLREATSALSTTLDMDTILDRLLDQVALIIPYDSATILIVEGDLARVARSRGYERYGYEIAREVESLTFEIEKTENLRQMVTSHRPLIIPDVTAYPSWRGEGVTPAMIRSWAGVPVIAQGEVIAFFSLEKIEAEYYNLEYIDRLAVFAGQVGLALQNARLFKKTQEQARQVRRIMDTVSEGVVLLDTTQCVALANPAAMQYLAELTNDRDPDQPLDYLGGKPIEDLLQVGGEPVHEVQSLTLPRHTFEIASHTLGASLQQDGWVLVMRDVTVERENQSRIQMQDRLATVGQLAAGIAHDFNNIMATISVYSDLLTTESAISAPGRERLGIIQRQVERASSLIRQILDFSRHSVMERSNLDLLPFIKELDKLLGRVLPENIRMELVYQPGIYRVNADPTRLQQVFMNLALNARDAMPLGGILRFEVSRLHLSPIDTSPMVDLTPGEWIVIAVRDTGVGISPDVLPHIFDPFFTTKPVGQGTGLGLSQAYGIIKQHGGNIDVYSQVGEGVTFTIYLPAIPEEEAMGKTVGKDDRLMGAGETILVVEDDWGLRLAIQAMLEALNYHVLLASNGLEALGIYDKKMENIELVVSDLVMPEMGGVALYHALRLREPKAKILFMTGHPLDEQDQALLEIGKVQWLQKPFDMDEFIKCVQKMIAGEFDTAQ